MTETDEPTPDLRTLAAKAIAVRDYGEGLRDYPRVTIGDTDRADAVLAAVLPAHREMVLREAAEALEGTGICDCPCREANLGREKGDRMHTHDCSSWPDREITTSRAAAIVRQHGGTGQLPEVGEPGSKMADEDLVEALARADYELAALDDYQPARWVALDETCRAAWMDDARRVLEWLAERGRLVPDRAKICDEYGTHNGVREHRQVITTPWVVVDSRETIDAA